MTGVRVIVIELGDSGDRLAGPGEFVTWEGAPVPAGAPVAACDVGGETMWEALLDDPAGPEWIEVMTAE